MVIVFIMVHVIVDRNGQEWIVLYKDVKNHVILEENVIMVKLIIFGMIGV